MAGKEEETGKLRIGDLDKDHRYPLSPSPLFCSSFFSLSPKQMPETD